MDIIVHFGAHRCATTSFQEYLRHNARALEQQGVVVWGPDTVRETSLRALRSMTPESIAVLQSDLDQCQEKGIRQLLISEENFLGMMPQNFSTGELYPDVALRAQLVSEAFAGRVTKVVINIRSLPAYWSSLAGYALRNKKKFGSTMRWTKIAQHPRSWQDVIADLAQAFPQVPLMVLPFEEFAGRPDQQLATLIGISAPTEATDLWFNKDQDDDLQAPSGAQELSLMTKFAGDLSWLASGADGLAQLCLLQEKERGDFSPA